VGSSRRGRRTWPQRLLLSLNVVVCVACFAVAAGLTFVRTKLDAIQVVSVGLSLAPDAGADEPQNILIIGTDNADRLNPDDPVRNDRSTGSVLADVIMVLRIDPKAGTASLLSIPRDTYIPISPTGRKAKINSAMAGPGGPKNLIDTIKTNFGLSIKHYVEVDFQGFRDLVDVLEGVPLYVSAPLRDKNTGLNITETGCLTLDAVQALAYARSRHLFIREDGKWVSDPTGDLGRISRQQDFIRRAGQRAIDRGLRDPNTALSLITAATQAVRLDDTLSVGDIRSIVDQYRSFNLDRLEKFQLPTAGGGNASISYQTVIESEAEPILDRFRGAPDADLTSRDVIVTVIGSNAEPMSAALEQAGFDADSTTGSSGRVAVIRFGPKGAAAARLLARHLDAQVSYVADASLPGRRVMLVAPSNLTSARKEPRPAAEVPGPVQGTATTTALASSATTVTSGVTGQPTPPATTTTVVGIVPVDAAAAAACTG